MKSPLSNKNVKMIECCLRAVFHSWSPGWGVFWRHGAEGSPRAAPPDNTPAVGVKRAAAAVLAGLITQAFFNIPLTQSRCPRHSRATPLSRCGTHQSVTFHRENQPVAPTSVTLKRFDWLVVGVTLKLDSCSQRNPSPFCVQWQLVHQWCHRLPPTHTVFIVWFWQLLALSLCNSTKCQTLF